MKLKKFDISTQIFVYDVNYVNSCNFVYILFYTVASICHEKFPSFIGFAQKKFPNLTFHNTKFFI